MSSLKKPFKDLYQIRTRGAEIPNLFSEQTANHQALCAIFTPQTTIGLAVEEIVLIEAESRLGNIYDPSNDACLDTRYEL